MFSSKKAFIIVLLVAASVLTTATSVHAQMKFGYIRSDYIFSNYAPYSEAQKQLEEYQKKQFDVLQVMKDELDKKLEDARAKEVLMTPEMKQQKMEELSKQNEELESRYENLVNPETGLMMKKQQELLQPIINRINEVLMKLAKDEDYDFIFDATMGPQGNTILFANEKYDISTKIVEELNKDAATQ